MRQEGKYLNYNRLDLNENDAKAAAAKEAELGAAESVAVEPEMSNERPRTASEVGRERWAKVGQSFSEAGKKLNTTFSGWGSSWKRFGEKAGKVGMETLANLSAPDQLLDRGAYALDEGMNRILDPLEAGAREKAAQFGAWRERKGEQIKAVAGQVGHATAEVARGAWRASMKEGHIVANGLREGYETVMRFGSEQYSGLKSEAGRLKREVQQRMAEHRVKQLEQHAKSHEADAQRYRDQAERLRAKRGLQAEFGQLEATA